ncbi:unnamed protein product [Paramecium primaurelia]|uniref:Uncharacterized protein n=1 Tax=Paramecium primaurelia TaxID=5886 RepID=A0A8S1NJJ5_PARPR|nr:unnamed protein product [Paramecium primaurelia]
MQTLINDTLIDSTNIANIEYHSESNNFDLRFLSITIDPYKQNNQTNQIQIFCHLNDQSDTLLYYIEIKGIFANQGSVIFNQVVKYVNQAKDIILQQIDTKCSIFYQNKFQFITSNQIQLKKGYCRPNYQSDLIEQCFKFVDFVKDDGLCQIIYVQQNILEVCVKNVTCMINEDKEIIFKLIKQILLRLQRCNQQCISFCSYINMGPYFNSSNFKKY